MFDTILIANRGEIACRVIATARRLGIRTVAVHSDADARALHVRMADDAIRIGPAPAAQSYIDIDAVMAAVRASGAQAVHPGYGFLSENAEFARRLAKAGVAFIGPPAEAIAKMGDKITSKAIAAEAGVSTVPGHMGLIADADEAVRVAADVGYPVMLKASAGGGGKGMRIARDAAEVREGFRASRNEARASFGDDRMFIERFVERPRHIEIQILADAHGACVHLGERECSIQRRNQKVVEEAPSPFLDPATRAAMGEQACALARAVGYASAGTVEFIVDGDRNFYFLEMNTRLQVEHPVTELITGIDLVEQMIRVAAGQPLPLTQDDVTLTGWAIESRLYAEDPYRGFLPSTGRLTRYRPPAQAAAGPMAERGTWHGDAPRGVTALRNDTGVDEGGEISMFYDPMIAKLCTWAPTRDGAVDAMSSALDAFEVEGIGHNLPFLSAVMAHPRFRNGDISTAFIEEVYPDGFGGAPLPEGEGARIAAAMAAVNRMAEIRRARISGRMDNHERRVGTDWVVTLGATRFDCVIAADPDGARVTVDGTAMRVTGDWVPGASLARMEVAGRSLILKLDRRPGGWRVRTGGADLACFVRTPRHAELAALMPVKEAPDMSNLLLCPMPGLLVRLEVAEGDEIEEGQPLATVEAMKMENVLRAPRRGRVGDVRAAPGDSLAVDQVILEFEVPG
ncbi:MAG: ATP-binding protein [Paracoccaceae bacterium]